MKEVYQRSIWSLLWNLAVAVFGAVALCVIIQIFTDNLAIAFGASGVVGLVLVLLVIFDENIRFEIEDGRMRFYKRRKLLHDIALKKYEIGYRTKSSNGSADSIRIFFRADKADDSFELDGTPLGISKFHQLFAAMERHTKQPSKKITTKKKGAK